MDNTEPKLGFLQAALTVALAMSLITSDALAQDAVAPSPTAPPTGATSDAPAPAEERDPNGNLIAGANTESSTERVFVTGSAIPTAQEVGANPVLTATREIIEKSGERTAEQFLRDLPVANANSIPLSNNNNGSDTAIGAAGVSLRGFDARATLVLIDGRRVAPYPITNSGIAFVDLYSIPRAAIETIEILKDGASTTYGADAVAGVVNIKLRKNYRGGEFNIEYGNTTEEDSSEFAASLVFGVGNDKTNMTGVLNYYHRNSIANRDRSYSAVPPFLSSNASPYNLQLTNAAVAEAGGTVIPTASGLQFAGAPSGTNGSAPASAYLYSGTDRIRSATGILPGFNFNEFSLSFPESERYGGYLSASHKIYGDQLVAYADGYYQKVKTHNELAPPATGNFQTTGATTIAIPPRVPNPAGTTPFGGPSYAETGVEPGAFNPFNPFNQIISGGSRARLAEFGNRLFDNETDAILATVGLRGDKLFDGTWGYDTAFRYSEVKNLSTGQQVSITRFNRILNQADPIFDPTSSEYIGTTVAFNPFGDFRAPITANQATVDFARVFPKDFDISKIWTVDGTIFTTALFNLPAGGVGFAAGGQFRRESLREDPDELNLNGDVAGNSPLPAARGGRKSYAFYAETSIPIFSPANALPGLYALEFTAAGRFEEFRNNDTNVMVPKLGLRWQPIADLTLRATWGKGFRQPALEELFGSGANSIEGTVDPFTGTSEPETTTLSNSNPDLQPEDSRSISAGFVYTPKFVPGLTLSVDFYDIERTGVVIVPEAQQVLQREFEGTLLPGEAVIRNPDGSINLIVRADQNAGFEKARGADFGFQYQRETPWGTFTWVTQTTFLDEFLRQQTALDPVEHLTRGPATDASDEGYYQWRGTSALEWAYKGFSLIGTVRYYDGFHEPDNAGLEHWVSQTWLFDLQASYTFLSPERVESSPVPGYSKAGNAPAKDASLSASGGSIWQTLLHDTRITIGCNNVFDKDPPTAFGGDNNGNGYPGYTYDATGQFVYVRLTKKF